MTLVDTNAIIDVLRAGPAWLPCSSGQLMLARGAGPSGINPVVRAEPNVHEEAAHTVDAMPDDVGFAVLGSNRESARLAAAAFRQDRQRGGARSGVLPDFFIGAQILAQGRRLRTRDAARYRTCFPELELICP